MMNPLLSLGFVFLTAYTASILLERYIPADLVYVLVGIIFGPFLGIIPESLLESEYTLAFLTMGMISFLLSPFLGSANLRDIGKKIVLITTIESAFTFFAVFIGFCAYSGITGQADIPSAIILGSLASLTSPAVALMLFREFRTKGPLTTYSIGISVFDDVSGLVIFALGMGACRIMLNASGFWDTSIALAPVIEISAPIVIGILCGFALSWFIGKTSTRDSMIIVSLAFILLVAGIAEALTISVLLTALIMGVIAINRSPYGETAISYLDTLMGPVFLIFFVIAGANFELEAIPEVWPVILIYAALRTIGKVIGTKIGAVCAGAPDIVKNLAGYTMLAQGGTDIGLALMVSLTFPQMSSMLTVVLGAVVIFEIIAPFATRRAILRSGEGALGET
jgi:Kef-type K+ transport system membrane component KefB